MIYFAIKLSDSCMVQVFTVRCFRRCNNLLLLFSIYYKVFNTSALIIPISMIKSKENNLHSEFFKYFVI